MVTPRRQRAEALELNVVEIVTFSRPDFMADARCAEAEYPVDLFFPNRGQSPAPAIAICRECLVVDECREYALADRTLDGVWGATTPDDRRRMRGAK